MIEIKVDNSECQITGLSVTQFKELKEVLSYRTDAQASYFSGRFGNKRYLLGRRGDFPSGLLYLVTGYLDGKRCQYKTDDRRIRPSNPCRFDLTLEFIPYTEQFEAAEACHAAGRGIVSCPTGTGKSQIAAMIINMLRCRTLVVVPTLELKRQLTESLRKAFGAARVGSFRDKRDIAVDNYDGLPMTEATGYDAVIIDEFHHSGAKTYRQLNKKAWKNIFYKIGLTATPFRANDNERLLLESVLSKVIYQLSYQDAVAKGYIVPVEAYFVTMPKVAVKGFTWPEVYKECVVDNRARNQIIADLMKSLHTAGKSTLTLVREISHGERLAKLTGAGFANGESEETPELIRGFNSRALNTIIGTVGVLGEGVDTKPAEYVIIAGLGKAKTQLMQSVGRAVRRYEGKESAKVILFNDESHRWTKAHFKAQCKILRDEYGVIPVKLDI